MQFALLVSQLPHVEEARTHYNGMLTLDARPRRMARMAGALAVLRTMLRKFAR